jgi:hypothetical protein
MSCPNPFKYVQQVQVCSLHFLRLLHVFKTSFGAVDDNNTLCPLSLQSRLLPRLHSGNRTKIEINIWRYTASFNRESKENNLWSVAELQLRMKE